MDDRTLKALIASRDKWLRNAEAETPDEYLIGPSNCALCVEFWRDNCDGCPVYVSTGLRYCAGTPYGAAENAHANWIYGEGTKAAAQAAAREEAAFLDSLIPEGRG